VGVAREAGRQAGGAFADRAGGLRRGAKRRAPVDGVLGSDLEPIALEVRQLVTHRHRRARLAAHKRNDARERPFVGEHLERPDHVRFAALWIVGGDPEQQIADLRSAEIPQRIPHEHVHLAGGARRKILRPVAAHADPLAGGQKGETSVDGIGGLDAQPVGVRVDQQIAHGHLRPPRAAARGENPHPWRAANDDVERQRRHARSGIGVGGLHPQNDRARAGRIEIARGVPHEHVRRAAGGRCQARHALAEQPGVLARRQKSRAAVRRVAHLDIDRISVGIAHGIAQKYRRTDGATRRRQHLHGRRSVDADAERRRQRLPACLSIERGDAQQETGGL
jgi:hypothetical protein